MKRAGREQQNSKVIKVLFLKRKVLSLFSKTDTDDKVFKSVGAATEKDLAPYVFKLK